ncbi:hypothetical protein C8J55DRAFT_186153 [Lentinula edodes]|uniref:Uncharacterized protein n=1 Tax=Lentinula lateritia TaxID=40482 RepID=A0A9W8ZZM0_9AGAR|nr:hypothetical protein C8J55DRAFT_186153 [Lentinula edodes]
MSNTETNTAAAEQNIASGNDGTTNFKRGDEGSPRGPGKCLMAGQVHPSLCGPCLIPGDLQSTSVGRS